MTSPTDIRDLLATIYASFSSGDGSAWESALGAEVMLIGTDEAEWWQGADVLPVLRAQLTEMSGTCRTAQPPPCARPWWPAAQAAPSSSSRCICRRPRPTRTWSSRSSPSDSAGGAKTALNPRVCRPA